MADVVQMFATACVYVPASVLKATKGASTSTINFAAGTYDHYLGSANGTESGAYLQGLLNAAATGWVVAMTAAGRWRITNTLDSWSLQWDGAGGTDRVARDWYGWRDSIGTTAAGTYATADYHPAGCLLARSSGDGTDWQPRARRTGAWHPALDGAPPAYDAGLCWLEKEIALRAQPRNRAVASEAGSPLTPVWPLPGYGGDGRGARGRSRLGVGAFGRYAVPPTAAESYDLGGWTLLDHLALPAQTSHALCEAFQDYLAAASTEYYDLATLDPRGGPPELAPTTPGWSRRWDVRGLRWRVATDP